MTLSHITPAQAQALIAAGARLIDIRGHDEHARERIPGAVNTPLDTLVDLAPEHTPVIFHCRSGMRTDAASVRLAQAANGAPCYVLQGGIDGWRAAGLETVIDRSQPLDIMRQVQIGAGSLVLAGVLFAAFVSPLGLALAGFVGAGLLFAGTTGWCGMAILLRRMPWNRRAAA